jgi:ubiquinone/menaquinone biosynthesis C-methylase UbiE
MRKVYRYGSKAMGESHPRSRHQSPMIAQSETHSAVADHYARGGLIEAIRDGLNEIGKSERTVTADDLAPVDEFHIGGRVSTREIAQSLRLIAGHQVLDIGCGLGGPARFIAGRYGCHVTGIDLTRDYVEAGNVLCGWLGLSDRVKLRQGNALSLPFQDMSFDAAYMIHVGMNIADKCALFAEAARVLRHGARLVLFDVMRLADGELPHPLPWATTSVSNAIAAPSQYRTALQFAGFDIISERDRQAFALEYFERQRAQSTASPATLGLQTLMGSRRPDQVRNMLACVKGGLIAPVEIVARKT